MAASRLSENAKKLNESAAVLNEHAGNYKNLNLGRAISLYSWNNTTHALTAEADLTKVRTEFKALVDSQPIAAAQAAAVNNAIEGLEKLHIEFVRDLLINPEITDAKIDAFEAACNNYLAPLIPPPGGSIRVALEACKPVPPPAVLDAKYAAIENLIEKLPKKFEADLDMLANKSASEYHRRFSETLMLEASNHPIPDRPIFEGYPVFVIEGNPAWTEAEVRREKAEDEKARGVMIMRGRRYLPPYVEKNWKAVRQAIADADAAAAAAAADAPPQQVKFTSFVPNKRTFLERKTVPVLSSMMSTESPMETPFTIVYSKSKNASGTVAIQPADGRTLGFPLILDAFSADALLDATAALPSKDQVVFYTLMGIAATAGQEIISIRAILEAMKIRAEGRPDQTDTFELQGNLYWIAKAWGGKKLLKEIEEFNVKQKDKQARKITEAKTSQRGRQDEMKALETRLITPFATVRAGAVIYESAPGVDTLVGRIRDIQVAAGGVVIPSAAAAEQALTALVSARIPPETEVAAFTRLMQEARDGVRSLVNNVRSMLNTMRETEEKMKNMDPADPNFKMLKEAWDRARQTYNDMQDVIEQRCHQLYDAAFLTEIDTEAYFDRPTFDNIAAEFRQLHAESILLHNWANREALTTRMPDPPALGTRVPARAAEPAAPDSLFAEQEKHANRLRTYEADQARYLRRDR